ncbi:YjbH domain-containing protein [Primorskyibacter sp. S187A]|uniref:YjbH domain-containing protein n=1 Tax=Primorskyibacter sp. S187A TaxID=3415130 RepID=UPI003C7D67D3
MRTGKAARSIIGTPKRTSGTLACAVAALLSSTSALVATDTPVVLGPIDPLAPAAIRPTLNFNGMPGLIDTPSAGAMPDGELGITLSSFAGFTRTTLAWQLTPRLSASFRYSLYENVDRGNFEDYYDRSFDVRYQLAFEGKYRPAIAIGLQDFAGTGFYAGEYIVASKTLPQNVTVSAGLGWGRYGSYNSVGSPFGEDRDRGGDGPGGQLAYDSWFRGPMSAFGGIEWRPTEKLGFKVEYSTDAYEFEAGDRDTFDRRSPLNFGVEYQVNDRLRLGAYSLYGDEIGLSASLAINPRRPATPRSDKLAAPISVRPDRLRFPDLWSPDWVQAPARRQAVQSALTTALNADGQTLLGTRFTGTSARVWVENRRYIEPAGAAGRIARALANQLPASVETFEIIQVAQGVPVSTLTLSRSDLERLETAPDRAEALLARAQFSPGARMQAEDQLEGLYPRFNWRLAPYTRTSYFDPRNPLLFQAGLRLRASYEFTPGLSLQGSVRQRLFGNFDEARISSTDALPVVRTDWARYASSDKPQLDRLTLSYATPLGKDLYGKVSAGFLERMYGGVSAEVLWKPVDSQLALGARVHHVRKRDADDAFGFDEYETTTGHASVYYEFDDGYLAQVDVGRYLAGDIGGTLRLSREFSNGWRVSAFATLTDVSAEDFGEGSFDKGISFSIPLSWASGKSSKTTIGQTIRPVQRDGGAQLNVKGLYESVRGGHKERYEDGWPLVWR